jgi:flagellar basal-body rod protein FlgC
MNLFPALGISASGADAMQTWIDTAAGNLANMNDAARVGSRVYAQQTPILQPVAGPAVAGVATEGVKVARVALGTSVGITTYEPTSPLANAQGEVAVPNVTLAEQMVGMISAQETYGADTAMMAKAQIAYNAALAIGA